MAFSKIRLSDGRELTIALDAKKVIEALNQAAGSKEEGFARFNTPREARVWVSPQHVAAVEDRPDLD
ncbi:MAG: hypothetical protein WDZ46_04280 [Solirubrobacterales bacterium]